ncbi:hypothetical protein ARALYDRAFT_487180, partial [Arabidopsis lyrata subsp. lyrata]
MLEDIFKRFPKNVLHASQTHIFKMVIKKNFFGEICTCFLFFPKVQEDDEQWNSRARGMKETRTFSRSSPSKRFVYYTRIELLSLTS